MSNQFLKGLLALIVSGILFSSCKKEKEDLIPTPQQYLSGEWRLTHFVTDYNNNNVLDEEEKEPTDQDERMIIFFHPDGTGYTSSYYLYNSTIEKEEFTWTLMNNETRIRIIHYYADYGNDTTNVKIDKLNMTDCVLENLDSYADQEKNEWIILKKNI